MTRNAFFGVAVALETALAGVLAFLYIGSKSFSGDEAVTVVLARLPWSDLSHLVAKRETNGALYFAAQRVLTHGDVGETGLRTLGAACAVASLPLLVLTARRLLGMRTAVAAGFLFAVDPLQAEYAQVGREYMLAFVLVALSSYAFVRGVQQERERWPWAVYALASALAVYAFLFAAVVPLMHGLSLAARPRPPWRRWGVAAGSAGLLVVPMAVLLARSGASSGVAWASGNLPGRIVVSIRDAVPKPGAAVVAVAVVLGAAAMTRRRLVRLAPHPAGWPAALLALWTVGSFVLVAAAAFVLEPLFVVRYFLIFLPPVVIALAFVVARLRWRAAVAVTAALAACAGLGLARWYSSSDSDFRRASTFVARQAQPDDGVLFYAPYVRLPFELYFERTPAARSDTARPVYPATPWGGDSARFIEYTPMPADSIAASLSRHRRVWLVLAQYRLYGRADIGYANVLTALRSRQFHLSSQRSFAGVEVRCYIRA